MDTSQDEKIAAMLALQLSAAGAGVIRGFGTCKKISMRKQKNKRKIHGRKSFQKKFNL